LFFYFFIPYWLFVSSHPSISISLLYFSVLSPRHGAQVFICPVFIHTAKSEIKVSQLSHDLCDITAVILFWCAILIASMVSDIVPIWFGFIRIEFAIFCLIHMSSSLVTFVTNRSSHTSWTLFPSFSVSCFHPSISSS